MKTDIKMPELRGKIKNSLKIEIVDHHNLDYSFFCKLVNCDGIACIDCAYAGSVNYIKWLSQNETTKRP